MPRDDGMIPIRSFSVCFQLERRIHKIDSWRIPLPYGLPLVGLGWAVAALVAIVVLGRLPLAGEMLGLLHPALRYVVGPVAVAYVLTRWRIDGRPAHAAIVAWTRWRLGAREVVAFRPAPPTGEVRLGDVAIAPDEHGARLRPAVIRGPARVVLRYGVGTRQRGRALRVRQLDDVPRYQGTEIALTRGQRVVTE